ncbi:MAG: sugar ABC transporter ATP-binding protein [Eubacteriales bacterium]|nr:sugar ABC transporter ATP-binding protein [Eubacteriales bacterium]MDD3110382.1 sugar ABC transporter ATP-binding protein [Eubacteriales bacterium]MDD3572286.1 sugar ABC transporter ATP-binding protein [Eubacteriales bacterium]MDD4133711.1 sugar ABC transporter ATP-binding protein [Eubacteriales bacterium]NLO13966.1 sugar ABC transporter ATP-binding protein [Clostridiales bacterium]
MPSTNPNEPLIRMENIVKEFPGVRALGGMTFDVNRGEIHCLVGENGAGKSTLMKILSGAYTPTSGTIHVEGQAYHTLDPEISQQLGIEIVYQENDLVPNMNAVENVFVGKELAKPLGIIDKKGMLRRVRESMREFDISIDPQQKIEDMSVSDQQFVKILKALMNQSKLLILDEPTSMFNVEDAGRVLNLVRTISARGIGIIYISHFLEEVVQIADRITVIRDGEVVRTYDNSKRDVPLSALTLDMVGRPVDTFYQRERFAPGEEKVLEVRKLKLEKHSPPISFSLKRGEILGMFGMVGSGRTEIVRALSGADRFYAGEILLNGKKLHISSPRDAIDAGIAHITEDRQRLGLNLGSSVLENGLMVKLQYMKPSPLYDFKTYAKLVSPVMEGLNVKTPSLMQEVVNLSGGNQQKVVLGKWLISDAQVFVFDEPTRGIDVNAKAEFYRHMTELAKAGKSIIMVSSEMPELISMSDRVLVVREGAVYCELSGGQINEQNIIKLALGVISHE